MPLDVHRMWNNTSLRFQPSVKPGVIRRGSRELGLDGISAGGRDKRKSKARSTDGGGNEAGDDCGSFGHRPDNIVINDIVSHKTKCDFAYPTGMALGRQI